MINLGFWAKLKKPILCLAPMADVTDSAFRFIISKYSKSPFDKLRANDFVIWTEFVSADGLVLAGQEGRKKLLKDLEFSEIERPIVAQFFTSKPEMMENVARLALELGFDGVDINMGCPDRSIEKQGAGAALIKNPELAKEIILAAKIGAKSDSGGIPVSVKTRLGYNKDELETWLPHLLSASPAVITIHARTRKEMSLVPARWERIKRAIEIRDESQQSLEQKTLIFGNGDVLNISDALLKYRETGCDGVMLGRAIFGNPWLFSQYIPSVKDKLSVLVEHTKLFEEKFRGIKSFAIMKKHYKAYVNGFDGASSLRESLMKCENASEVEVLINKFLNGV